MLRVNQEDAQYLRFCVESNNKINEIRKDYNKLSDGNKRRVLKDVRNILICKFSSGWF